MAGLAQPRLGVSGDKAFTQRMHEAGLSRWELGDLLGLHPHELHLADHPAAMNGQPVRVVAELAARLDLHPADLADALDPVLTNQREIADTTAPGDASNHSDAVMVLTALATTSVPLTIDELAGALAWTLERTANAIEDARQHPALAGPLTLRRVPAHRWTLTARQDILTATQRRNLAETAHYREPLSIEEATVLHAAYRHGGTPDYNTWRQEHLDAEHALKISGLLHSDNGPHHAGVHPDVRYSLDRRADP